MTMKKPVGAASSRTSSQGADAESTSAREPSVELELEKMRTQLLDMREKLLQSRETDLWSLREKLHALELQLKVGLAVAGILGTVLTFLGIKQYSGLEALINKSITTRMEESLTYYDDLTRAQMWVRSGLFSSALPILKELSQKRPADEGVFIPAIHCFIQLDDYEQGYEFLTALRQKGVFPNRVHTVLAYSNAGWLVFVQSLHTPALENEALELLRRAEEIAIEQSSDDIALPLYSLVLFYVAKGDLPKAETYAKRLRDLTTSRPDWRDGSKSLWFQRLQTKQPHAREWLEKLLPRVGGGQPSRR